MPDDLSKKPVLIDGDMHQAHYDYDATRIYCSHDLQRWPCKAVRDA